MVGDEMDPVIHLLMPIGSRRAASDTTEASPEVAYYRLALQ